MSREGYNRYLRKTLAKMRQRERRSANKQKKPARIKAGLDPR